MYCDLCGVNLPDKVRRCPYCSRKLRSKKHKAITRSIIILVLLVILGSAIGITMHIGSHGIHSLQVPDPAAYFPFPVQDVTGFGRRFEFVIADIPEQEVRRIISSYASLLQESHGMILAEYSGQYDNSFYKTVVSLDIHRFYDIYNWIDSHTSPYQVCIAFNQDMTRMFVLCGSKITFG